ncbi:MAG: hypothetical protein Pg6A_08460 [Termitinemataceae bacterium]|nr:MAG: hypothetical protein Pg6A_08460 [Termitinemataceae bacterium]
MLGRALPYLPPTLRLAQSGAALKSAVRFSTSCRRLPPRPARSAGLSSAAVCAMLGRALPYLPPLCASRRVGQPGKRGAFFKAAGFCRRGLREAQAYRQPRPARSAALSAAAGLREAQPYRPPRVCAKRSLIGSRGLRPAWQGAALFTPHSALSAEWGSLEKRGAVFKAAGFCRRGACAMRGLIDSRGLRNARPYRQPRSARSAALSPAAACAVRSLIGSRGLREALPYRPPRSAQCAALSAAAGLREAQAYRQPRSAQCLAGRCLIYPHSALRAEWCSLESAVRFSRLPAFAAAGPARSAALSPEAACNCNVVSRAASAVVLLPPAKMRPKYHKCIYKTAPVQADSGHGSSPAALRSRRVFFV